MSAGLRPGLGGDRPGAEERPARVPLVGRRALCSRVRSLEGTSCFLALATGRSTRVGYSRCAQGKRHVASFPLGGEPSGVAGLRSGLWVGTP